MMRTKQQQPGPQHLEHAVRSDESLYPPPREKLAPAKMACPGHESTSRGPRWHGMFGPWKSDRGQLPYDASIKKSGAKMAWLGWGATSGGGGKIACLGREKVIGG